MWWNRVPLLVPFEGACWTAVKIGGILGPPERGRSLKHLKWQHTPEGPWVIPCRDSGQTLPAHWKRNTGWQLPTSIFSWQRWCHADEFKDTFQAHQHWIRSMKVLIREDQYAWREMQCQYPHHLLNTCAWDVHLHFIWNALCRHGSKSCPAFACFFAS